MTSDLFLLAAFVVFSLIGYIMLPAIGRRDDFLKASPSEMAWYSKRIFPLMAIAVLFAFLGSQANSWGWP